MCPTKLLTAFRIPRIAITVLRIGASSWLIVAMSETVPATSEARPVQAPTPGHTREISRPARMPASVSPVKNVSHWGAGGTAGVPPPGGWSWRATVWREATADANPAPSSSSACRFTLSGPIVSRFARDCSASLRRLAHGARVPWDGSANRARASTEPALASIALGSIPAAPPPYCEPNAWLPIAAASAPAPLGAQPVDGAAAADSSSGTAASASWSAACSVTVAGRP